jgi:uncharacterized protein involved in outer membrane biogenesis
MNNFLIGLAVFLITLLAALFAVPYAVDWNGYRGLFEEEASRMLGREVRVGGAVNLHLLPTPYVSLERVRIANTSETLQEPFFRTESLTIKLAVPPMLRGTLEANEIELRRPSFHLAVDDSGTWNWQTIATAFKSTAPYLPSNVVLTSVAVKDGLVTLHGADGQERVRYEDVQAELSATALEGPYRMRATFGTKTAQRELRLATSKPEPDGSIRLKATLRALDTSSQYALDARVSDLMAAIHLDGELTAKLPFAGLWPSETRAPTSEAFDLKAEVKANADAFQLSNLSLAFEQAGTPQIILGEVRAEWRKALDVEAKLTSRWLDLDRIAGASAEAGPLDSILPFAQRLRELMPVEGRAKASLSIEQANIGRDTAGGVELILARAGRDLQIDRFRGLLPGGARLDMRGTLGGTPESPVFVGALDLRGSSLARFTSWASNGLLSSEGKADGSFGLRGQLAIENGRAAIRDVSAEISGTALRGTASYQWGEAREIGLSIEGPQLDMRAFVPAGADLGDFVRLLMTTGAAEPGKPAPELSKSDLSLRLSTARLVTAGATYRDVSVEIERKAGSVRIPRLRMAGDEGFALDLEGEVAEVAGRLKGALRIFANADAPPALRSLAELAGVPASLRPDGTRFQALAPLRVAGTIAFGQRIPTAVDISGDGEVNGGTLEINGRFDGGDKGWRSGPAELTVAMTNPTPARIAALLLPGTGSTPSDADKAATGPVQPGRVLLRAGGVPADGMATLFSLSANDTGVAFTGRFVAAPESPRLIGEMEIANADGARIAALAQLAPPLRMASFPLSGNARLATDGSTINVERFVLDVGGVALRGQLGIAPEGKAQRVNARIEADELSIGQLAMPLLDARLGSATAVAEAAIAERGSVWPPQPFDPGVFSGLVGDIQLGAKRLVVSGAMALSDARMAATVSEGRVVVREIAGTGLEGNWSLSFTVARESGGAELSGTLQATDVQLAAASGQASGAASAKISFQGRGVSPRALMAALQGRGTLTLDKAGVPVSPAAVGKAIDQSLKVPADALAQALRQNLAANLATPPLLLPATLDVELADGILRSKPISAETREGSVTGTTTVDVGAMTLASDWRLVDKSLSGKALPPAVVQYRGALASIGRLEPAIGTEALEREVVVRKMERDVDELERLRRQDELRRQEEARRRAAADAERLREQIERAQQQPTPQQTSPEAPAQGSQPTPRPPVQRAPQPKSLLPSWMQ